MQGIRSHKKDPSVFISQAMADIKAELRQTDPFIKAEAVKAVCSLDRNRRILIYIILNGRFEN